MISLVSDVPYNTEPVAHILAVFTIMMEIMSSPTIYWSSNKDIFTPAPVYTTNEHTE